MDVCLLMPYEEEGEVRRPAGGVGQGRGQECLRGVPGLGSWVSESSGSRTQLGPLPAPHKQQTHWNSLVLGGGGRSPQGSTSSGGESAAQLAGGTAAQVPEGLACLRGRAERCAPGGRCARPR